MILVLGVPRAMLALMEQAILRDPLRTLVRNEGPDLLLWDDGGDIASISTDLSFAASA